MSEELITRKYLNPYKMREELIRAIYNERTKELEYLINDIPSEVLNDYEEGDTTILHDICYKMAYCVIKIEKKDYSRVCECLVNKLTKKTIDITSSCFQIPALGFGIEFDNREIIRILKNANCKIPKHYEPHIAKLMNLVDILYDRLDGSYLSDIENILSTLSSEELNGQNEDGETLLYKAIEDNNSDLCKALIPKMSLNGLLCKPFYNDMAPFELAKKEGMGDIIELIKEAKIMSEKSIGPIKRLNEYY